MSKIKEAINRTTEEEQKVTIFYSISLQTQFREILNRQLSFVVQNEQEMSDYANLDFFIW